MISHPVNGTAAQSYSCRSVKHDLLPVNPTQLMVTIDPGLNGTGVAVWNAERLVMSAVLSLRHKIASHENWLHRISILDRGVEDYLRPLTSQMKLWVVEFPELHGGIAGEASLRRGDLFKLAALCGRLTRTAHTLGASVEFVHPTAWKGQLPKRVVIQRIRKFMGANAPPQLRDHESDAIGLGLWMQGRFN
jgi:hypothetical protein